MSIDASTDVATARAKLLELIKAKAIVHGKVTLSSGREADYYVDLRRISLDAEAAPLLGIVMRDLTKDLEYAAVGGRRVLVVEDTTTTGGSPIAAVRAVREAGGEVVAVATIADRATGAAAKIEAEGVAYRFVYSLEDLGLA